jgi:hypothetical protein
MFQAQCFSAILDVSYFTMAGYNLLTCRKLTLHMLQLCPTSRLLEALLDTLHRFSVIWTCMDVTQQIVDALCAAYQDLKLRGGQSRAILVFLLDPTNARFLSSTSKDEAVYDSAAFRLVSIKSYESATVPNIHLGAPTHPKSSQFHARQFIRDFHAGH